VKIIDPATVGCHVAVDNFAVDEGASGNAEEPGDDVAGHDEEARRPTLLSAVAGLDEVASDAGFVPYAEKTDPGVRSSGAWESDRLNGGL
jgi:hypothetical protein